MYSSNSSGIDPTFFKRLADSDPKHHFVTLPSSSSSSSSSSNQQHQFTIYHQFGQFAVDYNLTEWLAHYNKEYLTQRNALPLLQQSKRDYISQSFIASAAMSNAAAMLSAVNQSSSSSANGNGNHTNGGLVSSASGILENGAGLGSGLKRQVFKAKFSSFSIDLIYSYLNEQKIQYFK